MACENAIVWSAECPADQSKIFMCLAATLIERGFPVLIEVFRLTEHSRKVSDSGVKIGCCYATLTVQHPAGRVVMIVGFLVASFICLGVLCLSLPRQCWAAVKMNCYRLDGSFSRRRLSREVRAFMDYATTVAVPALLAFLTMFVVASFLFSYVIPLNLVVDSFAAFEFESDAWRANLTEVQKEHGGFLRRIGFDSETVQKVQSSLWHEWPVFAGGGILFVVASLMLLLKCAARSVAILATGIRHRRQTYAQGDVNQMRSMAMSEE